MADLVVSCTRKATYSLGDESRWLRGLHPAFASHPSTGEVDGVGLKVFPDPKKQGSKLFEPEAGD